MLEVKITDAQRQFEEGGKVQNLSFWTYKVETKASIAGYQNPPPFPRKTADTSAPPNYADNGQGMVIYMTEHRYSDFEALIEYLQDDFPGEILPPIPAKDSGGTTDKLTDLVAGKDRESARFNPFVQQRLRRLSMFLTMLGLTKGIHDSDVLKAFLTMERPDWLEYKEHRRQKKAGGGGGWNSFKSKATSFFGSVKKMTERHVEAFEPTSSIGIIRDNQGELATQLLHSMHAIVAVQAAIFDNKDAVAAEQESKLAANADKPLAYPIVFNGHFVSDKQHEGQGEVVHIDEYNYAYVRWDSHGAANATPTPSTLERVPVTKLTYPPNGLCDPAFLAAHQHAMQLDSFAAYICHRSSAEDLDKLIDLTWFWQAYAFSLTATVEKVRAIEQERVNKSEEAAKSKDKAQQLTEEATALGTRFQSACARFENSYGYVFRPHQKRALSDINHLLGKMSLTLLSDNEWGNRLKTADAALTLRFDPPDDVTRMLQDLAQSAPPTEQSSAGPGTGAGSPQPPMNRRSALPPADSTDSSSASPPRNESTRSTDVPSPYAAPKVSTTPNAINDMMMGLQQPKPSSAATTDDTEPPPPPKPTSPKKKAATNDRPGLFGSSPDEDEPPAKPKPKHSDPTSTGDIEAVSRRRDDDSSSGDDEGPPPPPKDDPHAV